MIGASVFNLPYYAAPSLGLSTTDSLDWGTNENVLGQPLCTAHYGFALTNYYFVYALAGQVRPFPSQVLRLCQACVPSSSCAPRLIKTLTFPPVLH